MVARPVIPSRLTGGAAEHIRRNSALSIDVLNRIAALEAAAPSPVSFAYMGGGTISGNWDTTPKTIEFYIEFSSTPDFGINVNPLAGTITLPSAGVWSVNGLVVADQASATIGEQLVMLGRFAAPGATVDLPLDVFQVAINPTPSVRSLAFSYMRQFDAGTTLSLLLTASADMGAFTFSSVSFEVEKVQ